MKRAAKKTSPNGKPGGRVSRKASIEALKRRVAEMSPLERKISEISDSVPMEDWLKLPRDLSYNHDHYLYGMPKRRR